MPIGLGWAAVAFNMSTNAPITRTSLVLHKARTITPTAIASGAISLRHTVARRSPMMRLAIGKKLVEQYDRLAGRG